MESSSVCTTSMARRDPGPSTANESRRAMIASQRMLPPMAEPTSESNPPRRCRPSLPWKYHALRESRSFVARAYCDGCGVVSVGPDSYHPAMQYGLASVWKALARGFSKYAKAGVFLSLLFASLPAAAVETARVIHNASVSAGGVAAAPVGNDAGAEAILKQECVALHGHCWASVSLGLQGYVPLIRSAELVASASSLQSVFSPPEPPPPRFSILL